MTAEFAYALAPPSSGQFIPDRICFEMVDIGIVFENTQIRGWFHPVSGQVIRCRDRRLSWSLAFSIGLTR